MDNLIESKQPLTTAERSKLYRKRNPERWRNTINSYCKKRYTCECGIEVCNKVRPKHKLSKRHIERMEFINKIKELETTSESSNSD